MEQATNSFNKGLLMDTHPMVLGNDTLSDCLNGTFITMNGNEVILQNDMGNRRIDRAFLPAGYEPVGIKEHGGIIYIASYNPITNRSLIGSFPSPLRTFKGEEELTKSISFDIPSGTNTFNNITIDNANFIDNFQEIILYSSEEDKDYNLHIGDMFILYGNTESLFNDKIPLISNIFNTIEYETSLGYETGKQVYKTYSPKNRLFTLLVGILNSQNSFIDLTDTLIRWDKEGKLIESKNSNEIYKKNDGNFIKNWTSTKSNTESDTKPKFFSDNKEENKDIANRYLYKLSGPLCLRKTLNHFLNFTYVIEIDKEENNYILRITANIIYNSPDCNPNKTSQIIDSNELLGDDTYYNFLQFESNNDDFNCFDLIKQIKQIENNLENWIWSSELYENYTVKITYNPETNLYNAIIERTYRINKSIIKDEKNFEFIVAPKLINYNGKPLERCYLRELCSYNKIDLSQINTGNSLVQSWNTYWDEKVLYLHYGIVSYPKMDEEYRNLRIKYRKYNTRDSFTTITLLDDNFSLVENEIKIEGLEEGLAYEVEILYDKYNKKIGLKISDGEGEVLKNNYWFFTTTLFNNTYAITSEDYISNIVEEENNTIELQNKLEKYKTIDEITFDNVVSDFEFTLYPGTFEGDFIGLPNSNSVSDTIKYNQILLCPNTISIHPKISDKYPANIFNMSNLAIINGDINYTLNIPLENGGIKEFKSYKENDNFKIKLIQQISGLNIVVLNDVKLINPYISFWDAMSLYKNSGCPRIDLDDKTKYPNIALRCLVSEGMNILDNEDTIKRTFFYNGLEYEDLNLANATSVNFIRDKYSESGAEISPILAYNTSSFHGRYYPQVICYGNSGYSNSASVYVEHPGDYGGTHINNYEGEVFDHTYVRCFPFYSGKGNNNTIENIMLVYMRKKQSNDFVLFTILCDSAYKSRYLNTLSISRYSVLDSLQDQNSDRIYELILGLPINTIKQTYILDFRDIDEQHITNIKYVNPDIINTKVELFKVDNNIVNSTVSINSNITNNNIISIIEKDNKNIFKININESLKISGKINKSFTDNYNYFSYFKSILKNKLGYENGTFNFSQNLILNDVWIKKDLNNLIETITSFLNNNLLTKSSYDNLNILCKDGEGNFILKIEQNTISFEYDAIKEINRMVTNDVDITINGNVPLISIPMGTVEDTVHLLSHQFIM